MNGALWLILASLALAAIGVVLSGMSWRARHNEQVMRRLSGEPIVQSGRGRSSHWLARRMRRAGIADMRIWLLGAALAAFLLAWASTVVPAWVAAKRKLRDKPASLLRAFHVHDFGWL